MRLKDGHTDVASAKRQCANIIEDCQDITINCTKSKVIIKSFGPDKKEGSQGNLRIVNNSDGNVELQMLDGYLIEISLITEIGPKSTFSFWYNHVTYKFTSLKKIDLI